MAHQNKGFFIALLVWPLIATAIVILLKTPYLLISGLIYFGIPALYLSWKHPQYIAKAATISVLLAITLGIPFEYFIELNREYVVSASLFGDFRILSYITLDIILLGIIWIYFPVMLYETSVNHGKDPKFIAPQFKNLAFILTILFAIFLTFYIVDKNLLRVPYFYLLFGIFAVAAPLAIILYKFSNLVKKFWIISVYFAYVYFLNELSSLYLGQWFFPLDSRVLGHVTVGSLTFAYEELMFYILLSTPAILAYYEYFDDDRK